MRFFRPEIEATLKMLFVLMLVSLIVLPIAWGYQQHRQARTWHTVACAYRIREVIHRTPLAGSVDRGDPCHTLERLGLQLELPR